MPTPNKQNLTIKQGAQFTFRVRIDDSNGDPFDITGYTPRCEIRTNKDKSSTLIATPTPTVLDATNGLVQFQLGATATAAITSDGYYDVEIENDGDAEEVHRVAQGRMKLDTEVTA